VSPEIFIAVLAAALMHASWNALIKSGGDRFAGLIGMSIGMGAFAVPALYWTTLPSGVTWAWLLASIVLHTGYRSFLGLAYAGGDLAQAYPLARGVAPMLSATGSAIFFAEMPHAVAIVGIILLGFGAVLLAFRAKSKDGDQSLHTRTVMFALTTSVFIAGYTISDGMGARSAADALSYAAWLFILDGIWCAVLFGAMRGGAGFVRLGSQWTQFLMTGGLAGASYFVAMWAMTKAPIGAVAALRESSILFALIISVAFLGEKATAQRVIAGLLIVSGVAAIKLA
jgi:drug/metabolite transporter (DMT)-like permease